MADLYQGKNPDAEELDKELEPQQEAATDACGDVAEEAAPDGAPTASEDEDEYYGKVRLCNEGRVPVVAMLLSFIAIGGIIAAGIIRATKRSK